MSFSYSAAARSAPEISTNAPGPPSHPDLPTSPESTAQSVATLPPASSSRPPSTQHLILDAGPLLSLTPLRHLAETFHTTPLAIAELRDPRAREHWERLSLTGVEVKVEMPKAEVMAKFVAFAKKTGDFAVLSQTDLSVIALTYQYEAEVNGEDHIRTTPGQKIETIETKQQIQAIADTKASDSAPTNDFGPDIQADGGQLVSEEGSVEHELDRVDLGAEANGQDKPNFAHDNNCDAASPETNLQIASEVVDEESDGEGDWITPANVVTKRSHDLGLLSSDKPSSTAQQILAAACMTGDYAVQNVLLGMGLGLVGEGGRRITKVRSWVLRCHACFKICKDSAKRFCPSCGNPTLLRTTVSTSATTGEQHIHLKKNFQYHLRGTKFTIPDAKPGRAKGQQKGGSGLILREDQAEWQDAVKRDDGRRMKEEKKLTKGVLEGWNNPDWLPEIVTVGNSGKGRTGSGGMPAIGHGRKNPNEARRKR